MCCMWVTPTAAGAAEWRAVHPERAPAAGAGRVGGGGRQALPPAGRVLWRTGRSAGGRAGRAHGAQGPPPPPAQARPGPCIHSRVQCINILCKYVLGQQPGRSAGGRAGRAHSTQGHRRRRLRRAQGSPSCQRPAKHHATHCSMACIGCPRAATSFLCLSLALSEFLCKVTAELCAMSAFHEVLAMQEAGGEAREPQRRLAAAFM